MLDEKSVIVVPVRPVDVKAAEGLFRYLDGNGWARQFPVIIAADFALSAHEIWRLVRAAKPAFREVQEIQPTSQSPTENGWHNWMMSTVLARYPLVRLSKHWHHDLCVFPPNSIPIVPGWEICLFSGKKRRFHQPVPFTRQIRYWNRLMKRPFIWYQDCVSKGVLYLKEGSPVLTAENYHPQIGMLSGPPVTKLLESLAATPRTAKTMEKLMTIRRWAAIGDVIATTGVARKLFEAGYSVKMVTLGLCAEALIHSPFIVEADETGNHDVDLDLIYENHPKKASMHVNDIFTEATNLQLANRGIKLESVNYAFTLWVTSIERELAHGKMKVYPRPWIVAAPRSNMAARSIPPNIIAEAAREIKGTVFWCSDQPAPFGMVDLKVRKIRDLMAYISMSDLVITVDSAPLHIAAGLKKPIVVVKQSFDPSLRISDQRDYTVIWRNLDCLPCVAYMCRINKDFPPCGLIEPSLIAQAVNHKLSGIFGSTVSAIIPVYNPDIARLNRCLTDILPQVNQVVIGVDGPAFDSSQVIRSPKIKYVSHFSNVRRGYGKTCNLAARESFGRFLLMLNDDCFANPDMVKYLLLEMEQEKTAVVGCLLRYPDGRIQHGGTVRRGFDCGHIDHLKIQTTIKAPCQMEWVTFAAALVLRDAFYQLDGFDERYDCYSEDSDLCLRMGRAGWRVRYTPHASAVHQESQTTSPMKYALIQSGNRIFREIWNGRL